MIELLVVVTIIVVLLSLLAPAMDKAITQAELASCGSRLKAMGVSLTIYAMDHKRAYPNRPGITNGSVVTPHALSWPSGHDLRPVIRDYLSINGLLQCPLSEQIDLDFDSTGNTGIFATYNMWFGMRYLVAGKTYPGMHRYGNRLQWTDDANYAPAENYAFTALAGDMDVIYDNGAATTAYGSHPDADGVMSPWFGENERGTDPVGALFIQSWSGWSSATRERGTVDLNFVHADGRVVRNDRLTHDDDRFAKLPHVTDGANWPVHWQHLPKE